MSEKIEKLLEKQNQLLTEVVGIMKNSEQYIKDIYKSILINITTQTWFSDLKKEEQLRIVNLIEEL